MNRAVCMTSVRVSSALAMILATAGQSTMSCSTYRQFILLVFFFGVMVAYQQHKLAALTINASLNIQHQFEQDVSWLLPKTAQSEQNSSRLYHEPGMAACLMIRDDNALLYEWLGYHYVTLPLRHVIVAADLNSTEDPHQVLRRWDKTYLTYTLWKADDFMHRFGDIPVNIEDHNHHYVHRQRAFFSSCAESMKAQNMSWVVFVDTDEYIVVNRINKDDTPFHNEKIDKNSTRYYRFLQRQRLDPVGSTVMDAIRTSNQVALLEPCHVIPRLLVGALENETCPQMDRVKELVASKGFDVKHLSTIRFVQTAPKNSFFPSKWGKVMADVSRLSAASLATKPKSSHRPFKECPKPLRAFEEAIIHANHYLGSWERYSGRKDLRRSQRAFQDRAYFSHGLVCEMHMDDWFPRFLSEFGVSRAKFLLGFTHQE
jgi:hypothetical protein